MKRPATDRAAEHYLASCAAFAYEDLLRLHALLGDPDADECQVARAYGSVLGWVDMLGDSGARDFIVGQARSLNRGRRAVRRAA